MEAGAGTTRSNLGEAMNDTILLQRRMLADTRSESRNYQRGEARYNAKLTPDDVRDIHSRKGEKNASLAAEFGVSESSIESIHHRRTWKYIE